MCPRGTGVIPCSRAASRASTVRPYFRLTTTTRPANHQHWFMRGIHSPASFPPLAWRLTLGTARVRFSKIASEPPFRSRLRSAAQSAVVGFRRGDPCVRCPSPGHSLPNSASAPSTLPPQAHLRTGKDRPGLGRRQKRVSDFSSFRRPREGSPGDVCVVTGSDETDSRFFAPSPDQARMKSSAVTLMPSRPPFNSMYLSRVMMTSAVPSVLLSTVTTTSRVFESHVMWISSAVPAP